MIVCNQFIVGMPGVIALVISPRGCLQVLVVCLEYHQHQAPWNSPFVMLDKITFTNHDISVVFHIMLRAFLKLLHYSEVFLQNQNSICMCFCTSL